MLASLAHRGPDDDGELELPAKAGVVWLGNRRLAILDTSPNGHQPQATPGGRLTITFNGEIYNYREVRRELSRLGYPFRSKGDTEVILAAWARWGVESLDRFRGMFAFAIWDSREQALWLVRDRIGERPLYYCLQPDRLLFASEVRCLLASEVVERRLDTDGLDSYLTFGSASQPHTLVQGMHSLEPGTILRWRGGAVDTNRYWFPPAPPHGAADPDDGASNEEIREALLEAVRQCLVSDVPVSLLLSGGVDTTAILALMDAKARANTRAFTVVFRGAEAFLSEGQRAAEAARAHACPYREVPIGTDEAVAAATEAADAMDQPSYDGVNTYVVTKAVRAAGYKVAISGQGSDEIFLGYRTRRWFPAFASVARLRLPVTAREVLSSSLSRMALRGWFWPGLLSRSLRWLDLFGEGDPVSLAYIAGHSVFSHLEVEALRGSRRPPPSRFLPTEPRADPLTALSRMELQHYLPNTLLRDADQMSMAHSLELRTPFLDHKLVELVMRLPSRRKAIRGRQKPVLVDASRDELVAAAAAVPKTGFVLPLHRWISPGVSALDGQQEDLGLELEQVRRVVRRCQRTGDFRDFCKFWSLQVLARWAKRHRLLPPR
jgi:asparagine synthase (glutamine-hydrolysing)